MLKLCTVRQRYRLINLGHLQYPLRRPFNGLFQVCVVKNNDAALKIFRPTRVLPVKATFSMVGCEEMADPAVFPDSPETSALCCMPSGKDLYRIH